MHWQGNPPALRQLLIGKSSPPSIGSRRPYAIGDHSVVLETTDGREIRITAWYDRARDRYVSEYERRSVVKSGGHDLRVWAQTPAYKQCTADDAASCLEAAVFEVDRINIY